MTELIYRKIAKRLDGSTGLPIVRRRIVSLTTTERTVLFYAAGAAGIGRYAIYIFW